MNESAQYFLALDVLGKVKYILSLIPASATLKQKLESILTQYNNRDDEDTLEMLIVRAYDLIVYNQELLSKSDTMYQHSESNTKCMKQISIQRLLNDTFDDLDGLFAEYIKESDHFVAFDDVKKKLR
ncbi:hypothetical protein I4U23_014658 [Adineta vaga]|nr:hypothetical protein I4U23_014658 [Adineta vaga]